MLHATAIIEGCKTKKLIWDAPLAVTWRHTACCFRAGIGLAANALISKSCRAGEKPAPPHAKSQVEATFAPATKWLFAARTSHAPKNGQNGGFDCLEETQLLV
jgi:hypothetical protein